GQQLKQPPQAPGGDPAAEAVVHGVPGAEIAGQVAPGDAGPADVQEGLEEQPLGQLGLLATAVLLGSSNSGAEDGPQLVGDHVAHGIRALGSGQPDRNSITNKGPIRQHDLEKPLSKTMVE